MSGVEAPYSPCNESAAAMPPRMRSELQSPLTTTKNRLRIGPPRDRAAEKSTLDSLRRLLRSGTYVHAIETALRGNEHPVAVLPEHVGPVRGAQHDRTQRLCESAVAHGHLHDS